MAKKRINTDDIDESFIVASIKKSKVSLPEQPENLLTPLPAKTETGVNKENEEALEPLEALEDEPIPVAPEPQVTVLPAPEPPKEESRRKRGKAQDYEALFVRKSEATARLGKPVNIRMEFHKRIQKIVQVIGGNKVSLYDYIDNVLAHHFDTFQEDINALYSHKNPSSIF
jgi:hypothetical protein